MIEVTGSHTIDCHKSARGSRAPIAIEPPVRTRPCISRVALSVAFSAFFLALSGVFPTTRAEAACSVPHLIGNGQVGDGAALMDNFEALENCANLSVQIFGNPATGTLPVFSSSSQISNGDLIGDCTTSGTLTVTCTKSGGKPFGSFAVGTDAGQLTGTMSASRFGNGLNADGAHFLRGDGVWAALPGSGGTASAPSVRGANIQSSSAASYTVTWPSGTIAGDIVIIFGEHAWNFNNPAGWTVLDNQAGSYANGFVVAKVLTASDITAGSVTVTTVSTYNGVVAAVTIDGSTMAGLRSGMAFSRSSSGPAAGAAMGLSSLSPNPSNTVLAFAGVRGTANVTFSPGFTPIASINAASASGALAKFTGTISGMGVSEAASSSAAGSGYYTAFVIIR